MRSSPSSARSGRSSCSGARRSWTRSASAIASPAGIGHISRVAGATNLDPTAAAEAGNAIQRFLVEETRLGIPALLHEETLHGLLARDAPIYQQSIGAAAAFDPELVEAIATAIRRRMRAIGRPLALAPVLDISPRPALGPGRGDVRRGPVPRGGPRIGLRPRAPGHGPRDRRRRDRQALRRPRPRRGRVQPGAGPHRPARAPRGAAAAVRGRRPGRRHRERHAGLLRRRRRALPRLARAADDDPARRVGLRRRRRVRLHRGSDARHRAPPDAGPGDGRGDGPAGRHGQRAAGDRRVRRAAPRGDRGRPGRRPARRPRGRAAAAAQVPPRAVRAAVRRPADGRRAGIARRRRARACPGPRPTLGRPRRERRDAAARCVERGDDRRRRPDRGQRPRPAGRLRPPAPHRDVARDAPPGEPVRVPGERRHQPDRRAVPVPTILDELRERSVRNESRTREASGCATATTPASRRRSQPRAMPRSRSSSSASAPG